MQKSVKQYVENVFRYIVLYFNIIFRIHPIINTTYNMLNDISFTFFIVIVKTLGKQNSVIHIYLC